MLQRLNPRVPSTFFSLTYFFEGGGGVGMVNLLPLGITDMTIIFLVHCYFIVKKLSVSDILFVLYDLILYVPSTIFQLNRDWSSWIEPVLS